MTAKRYRPALARRIAAQVAEAVSGADAMSTPCDGCPGYEADACAFCDHRPRPRSWEVLALAAFIIGSYAVAIGAIMAMFRACQSE